MTPALHLPSSCPPASVSSALSVHPAVTSAPRQHRACGAWALPSGHRRVGKTHSRVCNPEQGQRHRHRGEQTATSNDMEPDPNLGVQGRECQALHRTPEQPSARSQGRRRGRDAPGPPGLVCSWGWAFAADRHPARALCRFIRDPLCHARRQKLRNLQSARRRRPVVSELGLEGGQQVTGRGQRPRGRDARGGPGCGRCSLQRGGLARPSEEAPPPPPGEDRAQGRSAGSCGTQKRVSRPRLGGGLHSRSRRGAWGQVLTLMPLAPLATDGVGKQRGPGWGGLSLVPRFPPPSRPDSLWAPRSSEPSGKPPPSPLNQAQQDWGGPSGRVRQSHPTQVCPCLSTTAGLHVSPSKGFSWKEPVTTLA